VAAQQAHAVILFGGDTALAVWRALGISTLVPLGELFPGIAVSRSGQRIFVTKAGGYGTPDLVAEILRKWNS
jgi:uncharacterized protein YgbK (DUF1537 family)